MDKIVLVDQVGILQLFYVLKVLRYSNNKMPVNAMFTLAVSYSKTK